MKIIQKLILILLVLLFPLFSITCAIRVVLTPLYVNFEYNRPNFPVDSYGFTTADRLQWGQFSIDYLLGNVSVNDFNSQTLPDGTPLFNTRETSHMLDVRILTQVVLKIWLGLCIFFGAALILSVLGKWTQDFLIGLRNGAFLTIALIAAILAAVWMDFDLLFTRFHQLFFTGDTWLFYLSDTLIRLFPLVFWQDLFIFIGACTLLFCLIPILLSFLRRFGK